MCEITHLSDFRSALAHPRRANIVSREAVIAGPRPRFVTYQGKEYSVFAYSSAGNPIICIDSRMRALQPGDWERV